MPRAKTAAVVTTTPKTRRSAPIAERKRTPVRRKLAAPQFDASAHYDEIAHGAYLNWLARGGQGANPEEDWFLAEQVVRAKYLHYGAVAS